MPDHPCSWFTGWVEVSGPGTASCRCLLADARSYWSICLCTGGAPALPGRQTIAAHADALEHFIDRNGLAGVDTVGSSVGARLVLELARRGIGGHTVAFDPGGFWRGWETAWFRSTLAAWVRLVRLLRRRIPSLSHSRAARAVLLAQLSARPGALDPLLVRNELTAIAETDVFDSMLRELARGPLQEGTATPPGRLTIGWGRQERLLLPRQAERAQAAFPTARLYWFERCGHFPQWDRPKEAAEVILKTMARCGADNGRDLSSAVQFLEKLHKETEITRADASFVRSADLHLRK